MGSFGSEFGFVTSWKADLMELDAQMNQGASDKAHSGRVPGQAFRCEACGHDSVVKREKRMDGWRCVGEQLVCALCGEPLAEDEEPGDGASGHTEPQPDAAAKDRLAMFLGEDAAGAGVELGLGESDGRFCKNCRSFLRHPFRSRCLLHERDVEPMDDCSDFEPVPEAASEDAESESDAGSRKDDAGGSEA